MPARIGWDGAARTRECRRQSPVPYHLATSQCAGGLSDEKAGAAGLFAVWGGIWGSNPRHPEPQSGALPTELIPPYTFQSFCFDAGAPGGTRTPGLLLRRQLLYPAELLAHIQEPSENGAGEGNRTLVPSLEGWYSTIELHPQAMRAYHYPRRMSRVPERKTLKIRRGMEKFLSDQP